VAVTDVVGRSKLANNTVFVGPFIRIVELQTLAWGLCRTSAVWWVVRLGASIPEGNPVGYITVDR